MSDRNVPTSHRQRGSFWTIVVLSPAMLWVGCATPPEPEVSVHDISAVQDRIEDVERTNGRLMVRVEEMERQVAIMQDRVESNRIALQRHGYLGRSNDRFARAAPPQEPQYSDERPQPAPQSHYRQAHRSDSYQVDPSMRQRMDSRGGTRIPLSDQQSGRDGYTSDSFAYREEPQHSSQGSSSDGAPVAELVITNEELEARYGPSSSSQRSTSSSSSSSSSGSSSSSSSGGSAHPPVTSERLPTSAELDAQRDGSQTEAPAEEDRSLAGASDEELLDLYQDSLAQYRAGDYGEALVGFQSFLDAGPRADYVDNALYWIGECHYGLGKYETSVAHFQRIIDELPRANKVPDAMLKMSLAYDRLGQPQKAYELLVDLTERFPNSNPGRLGAERLEEHYANDE